MDPIAVNFSTFISMDVFVHSYLEKISNMMDLSYHNLFRSDVITILFNGCPGYL